MRARRFSDLLRAIPNSTPVVEITTADGVKRVGSLIGYGDGWVTLQVGSGTLVYVNLRQVSMVYHYNEDDYDDGDDRSEDA